METILESLNKATILLDTLIEEYSIYDCQNPSEYDQTKYSRECGRIHTFLSLAGSCVTDADKMLREKITNK